MCKQTSDRNFVITHAHVIFFIKTFIRLSNIVDAGKKEPKIDNKQQGRCSNALEASFKLSDSQWKVVLLIILERVMELDNLDFLTKMKINVKLDIRKNDRLVKFIDITDN